MPKWGIFVLAAWLLSRLAAPKTPRPTECKANMRNEVSNYEPACRAEDENQYEFMSIRFSGEGTSRREILICWIL